MPRKPRLFLPGATYHVYCRVARGEFVFDDAREANAFVDAARDIRDLDGWRVLAWCIMANHYHLVITTDTVPLWKSMARLQGRVSRNFNKRRRYLGRLWQSRYRARLVDSQDYFLQVVSYVHLNPVAGQNTNAILTHLACRMCDDFMAVFKLDPERGVGQKFLHDTGEFEHFFLGHGHSLICAPRGGAGGE